MRPTKSKKILDTKEKKRVYSNKYTPSLKEQELVSVYFNRFRNYADVRDKNLENFDGMTLVQYIEESYRRYTTNVDIRDGIEDWQSITHDQMTRNKVNSVLAKVVSSLPVPEVSPRGDEDPVKASIINDLYTYSEDIDDYEEFAVRFLLEAIVKGTAIGYEGSRKKIRKVRDIVHGDGDDIKISESEIKERSLFAEIVPLEDFYPESISVSKIKDLASCFRRERLSYEIFLSKYSSMFAKADFVEPKRVFAETDDNKPFYLDYISDDVNEGYVEVLYYYNKDADEYIIMANGVWLNPIVVGEEKEEISPIPFNHKELPFFDLRFELFSGSFFYGKSLPNKLQSMQDVLNVLTNMLLDQSFLTIFPPLLTNGFDSIEDDYLRPGRRTPIDTQGLPINQSIMSLDMKTPGGWHQFILDYTRKVMEEASVDKVTSGQAGVGDRTTAKEIAVAAEGVSALLGLFGRWIKYSIKRKANLRTKNILQFWTQKGDYTIEGILGQGGTKAMKDAFAVIKIDNTVLTKGKRGTKVIGLYEKKEDVPTSKELKTKAKAKEILNNMKVEYLAVPVEQIRDISYDIKMVVNTRAEHNRDYEKAITMEKVKIYKTFFPNLVDNTELFAQLAEKLGDDPQKIMLPEAYQNAINPQDSQGTPKPELSTVDNSMRSITGKQPGMQNLSEMMLG